MLVQCTMEITFSSGAMDTFARGLKSADRILTEGVLPKAVQVGEPKLQAINQLLTSGSLSLEGTLQQL